MTPRARLMSWSFALDRVARVAAITREELAFRFLDEQDWLEVGRSLYGRAGKYARGSVHNESGLFAFEHAAIEEAFPPPPASILVGACGAGREIFALLDRGYRIAAAYDPVDPFIETLRQDPRLCEMRDRLRIGSHQAIESMPVLAQLRQAGKQADAVVVGWGSYTHLRGAARRVGFLRSLRTFCPRGPVLLSFFVEAAAEVERPARLRARLRRFLRTTGSMVEPGDGLHRGAGAIHRFTEADFTAEAAEAGYRVRHWEQHDFAAAHAILVPQTPS